MRTFSHFAFAAIAAFIGQTLATPIVHHPNSSGGPLVVSPSVKGIKVTSKNTVNGTNTPIHNPVSDVKISTQATQNLPLSFVNNLGGGQVNAYVTGLNVNNALVILQPDGKFFYPITTSTTPQNVTANVAIPLGPQGSTTKISLPGYISAARVWFAVGELQFFVVQGEGGPSLVEPSAVNPSDPSAEVDWGFVELTNTEEGGLYANISYVDFVGLVLGMAMTAGDGSVQTAQGLVPNAVSQICSDLVAQATIDGQPWDKLCMKDGSGNSLRVIAPSDYVASNPSAFGGYWTDYVNQVWTQYTSQPLTIDTQASAGNVSCTVTGNTLNCAGDNRGYPQPVAGDIFGCNSGPFGIIAGDNAVHAAVVPRLCAAFDRSTLLLLGGNCQPHLDSSAYYTVSPTNWYSKTVHKYEVDGKGYAFAYDDVNPDGGINQSGVVSDANPQQLTITIGGPGASSSTGSNSTVALRTIRPY